MEASLRIRGRRRVSAAGVKQACRVILGAAERVRSGQGWGHYCFVPPGSDSP